MLSDLVPKILECIIVVIVVILQTSKSNGGKIFQCQLLVVILSVHLISAGFCDIQSLISQ